MPPRMERVYYNVIQREGDGWIVGIADEQPLEFDDKQQAIDAAEHAALGLWERYGMLSGVNVTGAEGKRERAYRFG